MGKKMFLKALILKNFKNLNTGQTGLALNNLNILIGPNGSGKSNLIGMLEFLKQSLSPGGFQEQTVEPFENAVIELGDQRILDATLEKPGTVSLGYRFQSENSPGNLDLDIELLLKGANTSPVIKKELLSSPDTTAEKSDPFFYYKAHDFESGKGVVSCYKNGTRTGSSYEKLPRIPVNRLLIESIPELLEETALPPENTPVYNVRRRMTEAITDWRFYNANEMNPKHIRDSEPKIRGNPDIYLSPSGENLPLVFDGLVQADFSFEELINREIRKVVPGTLKIRPLRSGNLRLMMEWHMDGMKEPFHLSDMSDGTIRMLCWAVILLSPKLPPLIVIDEPEMGLHPAWMKTLALWIKQAAEKTQLIISTHSPDLLDHFTDRYKDVISFESDPHHHFQPQRLKENLVASKLKEDWELGDLYRVGDPATGGWPW